MPAWSLPLPFAERRERFHTKANKQKGDVLLGLIGKNIGNRITDASRLRFHSALCAAVEPAMKRLLLQDG